MPVSAQLPPLLFLVVIALHYVADFKLQTTRMSQGKSTSWVILAQHVMVYASVMAFGFLAMVWHWAGPRAAPNALWFFAATFLAHFATDAITSRITSRQWKEGNVRGFLHTIGLDQMLHGIQLYLTWLWLA